jgi:serine protease Do
MYRRILTLIIIIAMGLGLVITKSEVTELELKLDHLEWKMDGRLQCRIQRAIRSTVKVGGEWSGGSGVIIDPHTVLTARHVINDSNSFTIVTSDGTRYKASSWACGIDHDYGFLFFEEEIGYGVERGDSDRLRIGDAVFTVGSPMGFDKTVSYGIVANLDQDMTPSGWVDVIFIDAIGNPGSSGGPVFNMDGRLIGIVVGTYSVYTGNGTVVIPINVCDQVECDEERNPF